MGRYGFLLLPSANRVYARAASALAVAELAVFAETVLEERLSDMATTSIGGVPYVTFTADTLAGRDLGHLANLSSLYALFELDGDRLRPVGLRGLDRFDDDLLTIQRYQGKTNEQFTKLLLNVTLACAGPFAASGGGPRDPGWATVLDPVCGRGTTLNQALTYGCHAVGIDIDGRAVDAWEAFAKAWLQEKRIKHRRATARIRRDGRVVGRRVDIVVEGHQRMTIIHDDGGAAAEHLRRATVDVIVGDLPYGVQHRSGGPASGAAASRDPAALLGRALPAWSAVLRPGGAIGLAWNTHVLRREDLVTLLGETGFQIVDLPAAGDLCHRVDRSITRDVVVARKP